MYNDISDYAHSPSQVNFLIFTACWTTLALIYLVLAPTRFPKFAHKFVVLAVELITALFWFAGFIALAVLLSDFSCRGGRVCGSMKAATAFSAFNWSVSSASFLCTAATYPSPS